MIGAEAEADKAMFPLLPFPTFQPIFTKYGEKIEKINSGLLVIIKTLNLQLLINYNGWLQLEK